MTTLANVTANQVAEMPITRGVKMLLADLSLGLTMEKANAAPKFCQLSRHIDPQMALKMTIIVLSAFVNSVKVTNKLDDSDILVLADELVDTYPLESLEDIILALKQAQKGKTVFYNKLDQSDIYRLIQEHLEHKAQWLDNKHLDQKAHGSSAEHNALAQLGEFAPKLLQRMSLSIDPTHPNAESLRMQLSLTNNCERRNIITSEDAEKQRKAVATRLVRKPRLDWH